MVGRARSVVTSRRRQEDVQARLDHHLLPDPVARSISCLVDRIDQLGVSWRCALGKRRRILTTATVAPVRPATCGASMWTPAGH